MCSCSTNQDIYSRDPSFWWKPLSSSLALALVTGRYTLVSNTAWTGYETRYTKRTGWHVKGTPGTNKHTDPTCSEPYQWQKHKSSVYLAWKIYVAAKAEFMCTCETMRFTLHRISRWFDHGYCVILSRSVNRRVKASQAQTRLHHSNWHLEQSSPVLHSFKLYGSLLKPTERSPNPPRMEKGRWIAIEGKRKGAWVWKCVCACWGEFSIAD